MYQVKPIQREAIPRCLAKADRYRLLNEPREAESICRDILAVEPDHAEALATLLLSLTDQFSPGYQVELAETRAVLGSLRDPYQQTYYTGVTYERWAKAQLARGVLGEIVYEWFREAMAWYERAERLAPPGNEDAVLRWNTCARTLDRDPSLRAKPEPAVLGD
jgi:hypothetical protein